MVMNPYEHMGDPQEMGYENGGGMDPFYPVSQAFAREPVRRIESGSAWLTNSRSVEIPPLHVTPARDFTEPILHR